MRGITDATCRDCNKVIEWDVNMPRRCAECLNALIQPKQEQEALEPDDEVEEISA